MIARVLILPWASFARTYPKQFLDLYPEVVEAPKIKSDDLAEIK